MGLKTRLAKEVGLRAKLREDTCRFCVCTALLDVKKQKPAFEALAAQRPFCGVFSGSELTLYAFE